MTTPTITDYLKYANLQMAAEAFLVRENGTVRDDIVTALKDGNLHASRFTQTQADAFTAQWEVVSQQADTNTDFSGTGFSGTLFRNKANPNELVISFRSTEFIDDAARDNEATNREIKDFGFAFGQLADMETWYESIKSQIGNAQLSVTGYSLGGHLATAFNLMHPGVASQVLTFNGAGIGKIGDGTLDETKTKLPLMVATFQALRAQADSPFGLESTLSNLEVRAAYRLLKLAIAANNGVPTESMLALLPVTGGSEAAMFADALKAAIRVAKEAARAPSLSSGPDQNGLPPSSPALVPDAKIDAELLDYQLAVRLTAAQYGTKSLSLPVLGLQAVVDKTMGNGWQGLTNQYDLVGTETTTTPYAGVANSQYHYGIDAHVFIEDQPLYRGTLPTDASKSGYKLLVPGYNQNDFGDTHSLVLIVDSLNVQNLLQRLAPTATQADIEAIFKAASAAKAETTHGTQGKAEGDVLENILNSLSKQLLGASATQLAAKMDGNTWANSDDRTAFYNQIKALTESESEGAVFRELRGKVWIERPDAQMATRARNDFSDFLGLQTLSPFVLRAAAGDEAAVESALMTNWNSEFFNWKADQELTAGQRAQNQGNYTNSYFADRAAMLTWMIKAQSENTAFDAKNLKSSASAGLLQNAAWDFTDKESGKSVFVTPSGITSINPDLRRVVFGGADGDSLNGYDKEDHLYGGAGEDTLTGNAGNDYLQGDGGVDTLLGGLGRDTLLGGTGNDILEGGKDTDTLNGGLGDDTYKFASGDGWDWIDDQNGADHIDYDTQTLGTQPIKQIAPNIWQEETGGSTITYSLYDRSENGETFKVLAIQGANGGMWVKRWQDGQLGISLPGAPAAEVLPVASPASTVKKTSWYNDEDHTVIDASGLGRMELTAVGNYGEVTGSGRLLGNEFANYLHNGEGDDELYGFGGKDTLIATGGNDKLDGGDGDDALSGGTGNDILDGGIGSDVLAGGTGRDILIGDGGSDTIHGLSSPTGGTPIAAALAGGDTDASVDARGDWVDGQAGNDILIGSAAKDLLTGGDDNDLLIGGAGDDLLLGDASLQQAYADWSVDRNVSPPDSVTGVVTYQWTINRGTTTGSDSIGGAGDDMLISADIADRLSGGGGDTKSRRWRDGGLRRRAGRIAKVGAGETAGNDGQWRIAA